MNSINRPSPTSTYTNSQIRISHLQVLLLNPLQPQKGQAPKLLCIALRRGVRAKRYRLKHAPGVLPAPHLAVDLRRVGFDEVPEVVICVSDFVVDGGVVAEVCT